MTTMLQGGGKAEDDKWSGNKKFKFKKTANIAKAASSRGSTWART
jgi:hypothetical protein